MQNQNGQIVDLREGLLATAWNWSFGPLWLMDGGEGMWCSGPR